MSLANTNLSLLFAILQAMVFVVCRAGVLDDLYPRPRAIRQTYDCCVYYGASESDLDCLAEDVECRETFKTHINNYLIASIVIVTMACILFIIFCLRKRCKVKRQKRLQRTKKGPMLQRSESDFFNLKDKKHDKADDGRNGDDEDERGEEQGGNNASIGTTDAFDPQLAAKVRAVE